MQTALIWICAVLSVLLLGGAWAANQRIATLNATIEARDATIRACNGTNATNLTTIETLEREAKTNATALQAAKINGDALLARVDSLRETAAAAEAREEQLRRSIYAEDPDCARWGDQPVCPGIARRLLERQAARPN